MKNSESKADVDPGGSIFDASKYSLQQKGSLNCNG